MKRTPMPARKAPLEAKAELRRTSGLNRSPVAALLGHDRNKRMPQPKRRDTGPSRAVRDLVARRSGGWCEWLSCPLVAVHVHHRRPRRMGGSSDPATNRASNLVALCVRCHDYAESHRHQALAAGVLLHADADPKTAPVQLRYGLVLLDDLGTFSLIDFKED